MTKTSHLIIARTRLVALVFACLILTLLYAGALPAGAQTPPCTQPPPDDPHPRIARYDTVYVTFDSSVSDPQQRQQILQGMNAWTQANLENGSGIAFVQGPPPSYLSDPTTALFQNMTVSRTVNGVTTVATDVTAITSYGPARSDGSLRSFTVTFNDGALADPGDPSQGIPADPSKGPYYNPSLPGYDTVYRKKTQHELGHPLGAGDIPGAETPGGSVMNGPVRNCPNDNCGHQPLDITPCDKQTVADTYPTLPECDPYAAELCTANLGYMNLFTCQCEGVWYYWNPDPYGGGGYGSPCNHTYSCTPAYTGVWVEDEEGGGHWDMEFDSWACYYEGCY